MAHNAKADRCNLFRPMVLRAILAAIGLMLGAHARPALAQCGPTVTGRFGGEVTAVAQVNTSALLVAHGTEVELFSLANPAAPAPFSPRRKISLDAPAVKIAMTAGSTRAFVLMKDGNVRVINVSYSPLLAISSTTTVGSSYGVDIVADGQLVYVARNHEDHTFFDPFVSSRVYIYDLTSGSPVLRSSLQPLTNLYGIDRIAKVGSTLWMAFHEFESSIYGVDGFDVSNPSSPVRTGAALNSIALGEWAQVSAMTAIGSTLLVSYLHDTPATGRNEWMAAVDVSAPAFPAWRTPVNLNGVATCMSSIGNNLRIAIASSGIGTWNTTNPSSLSWLGAYFDAYPVVTQMVCSAGTDYWAAGRAGLMTMNTANPASVSSRSSPIVPLPIGPSVVRQKGNTTVVLDYTLNTLRLYDFTLAEAQQLRSSFFLPLYSELIEIADLNGGATVLACVATKYNPSGNSITIIDITNPAAPVTRSTITGVNTHLMSASGSRLYVFTTSSDFQIYELAQPLSPQLRSSTHYGGSYYDFKCLTSWSNNAAALGTESLGLWLINTTNATAPLVSAVWNPVADYHVRAITKGPTYLYASARVGALGDLNPDARLETLNVNNIAAPTQRFVCSRSAGAGYPGEFASLAYIAAPSGKFLVGLHDRSDPWVPDTAVDNDVTIYELPPGFFTNEAVPFPIATLKLPYARPGFALSADSSRFILAADGAGLYQVALPSQWAPGFGLQAFSRQFCNTTANVTITAAASGNPATVTYQWYRDGAPLVNGPTGWGSTIAGATDSVLIFYNPKPQDARSGPFSTHYYRCVATNSCGSATSFTASLSISCATRADVAGLGATQGCDGQVTADDLILYLSAFFANDLTIADIVGLGGTGGPDGQLTPDDLIVFLSDFMIGCQ